MKQEE